MEKRTMVKFSADSRGTAMRTVSRDFKSPCSIFIRKEKLQELREKDRCTVREGLSVADMERHVLPFGEECVRIFFIWLQKAGENDVRGYTELIYLPYHEFFACAAGSQERGGQRMLSAPAQGSPVIELQCGRRLKEVAGNRAIRKKFGRFLGSRLSRMQYKRIVLTDDCEPYSFGFSCYTTEGLGMCGGIILQKRARLRDASYGMHT